MNLLDLSTFRELAVENCFYFVDGGCSHDLLAIEGKCRIYLNEPCPWFRWACLPAREDRLPEWLRIFESEQVKGNEGGLAKSAQCQCGTFYTKNSNRQERCPDCSKTHERGMARQRKRKQRGRRVTVLSLSAKPEVQQRD